MPKKAYALEREAPKRLEVEWDRDQRTIVRWDGRVVGSYVASELDGGVRVTLPEGSVVLLSRVPAGVFGGAKRLSLRLEDGTPLPGSDDDPMEAAKRGGYILYFIAGLNALCGVIAMATGSEALLAAGLGVGSLIMAVLYGVLGLFTIRGSRVALGIAMGLYALDWIVGFVMQAVEEGRPNVGGIFVRIVLLAAMGRALVAMGGPKAR